MHLGILVARRVRSEAIQRAKRSAQRTESTLFHTSISTTDAVRQQILPQAPHRLRSGVRLARHAVRLRMYNHDTTDAPLSPPANASIEHVRDMSGEQLNSVALVRD